MSDYAVSLSKTKAKRKFKKPKRNDILLFCAMWLFVFVINLVAALDPMNPVTLIGNVMCMAASGVHFTRTYNFWRDCQDEDKEDMPRFLPYDETARRTQALLLAGVAVSFVGIFVAAASS